MTHIAPSNDESSELSLNDEIFLSFEEGLEDLAWEILNERNQQNNDIILLCIQVDSHWKDMVDLISPGHDWQGIRDQNEIPISISIQEWKFCYLVADIYPQIAEELIDTPNDPFFKVIVLSQDGCDIYHVEPKKDKLDIN